MTAPVPAPSRQLTAAALGTFLTLVAFTAPLATLIPIAAAFGAGTAGRTWVLSSMSVGLGAALLSAGTVSDDTGRRRTFVAGLVVLVVGSLGCALAGGTLVFVLARVVQGVGSAAVLASSLGIVAACFPPGPGRAAAGGVWGASVGAGIAVGPLLSAGADRLVSWRAAYVVLALTALALGAGARRWVAESRSAGERRLDVPGAVALGVGTSALLAGLVEGRQDWTDPKALGLLGAAVVVLVAFVLVERASATPMLDLALFRHPPFVAATVAALANGAGVIALMSYLSGFVGSALDVSSLGAALLLLVWSASSVVTALLARRLPGGWNGRAQLAAALVGVGVGQALLLGVATTTTWRHFVPGLLVAGVASGVLNAALGREAVASVPPGRGSVGSGANNTARYVGSAVGVTVIAVVAAAPTVPGLVAGWNHAVLVAVAVSLAGAATVLASGRRAGAR